MNPIENEAVVAEVINLRKNASHFDYDSLKSVVFVTEWKFCSF